MYSKELLRKTVDRKLKEHGYSYYRLAKELSIQQSNLTRALDSDAHNFTIPQLSTIVTFLNISPHEIYRILTSKKLASK